MRLNLIAVLMFLAGCGCQSSGPKPLAEPLDASFSKPGPKAESGLKVVRKPEPLLCFEEEENILRCQSLTSAMMEASQEAEPADPPGTDLGGTEL